ncbi:unnamed protein product [Haemonchus placei]|uniref:MARVEL domain-containing protein n=1 Tax=Haemonchus placei TaxID=6290 RepID=A0A0N4WHU1_HAEPC|nr:unnamed protein product [Haemonchus placei]
MCGPQGSHKGTNGQESAVTEKIVIPSLFEDCLIFHFSHFDITLIFDYIVIAIISFMLFSICLLMYGILTDTSCLLLPHILIQAVLLLFSIGYFCLYAVSYFYGDLYKHSRPFKSIQFIERMWLATLLLALAAFQTYLFSSVIRCSMYISVSRRYKIVIKSLYII